MNTLLKNILSTFLILVLASACAKKSGYKGAGTLGGRGGEGDTDELCDEQNNFYDIPRYEEDFSLVDGGLGEFTMSYEGNDRYTIRRSYIPAQIPALTFTGSILNLMGNITENTEFANVRFMLFSSCSTEAHPIQKVLRASGQEIFKFGHQAGDGGVLPPGGSLTITMEDPYRYDVMIVEYVGQQGTANNGQQGQIIPAGKSVWLDNGLWSAGCFHEGGYCDL